MGIMSSTESNSRNVPFPWNQIEWEKLGSAKKLEDFPEKEIEAIAEAAMEFFIKEVDALLPPKLGDSSTNKPKEEWDEEVFMRLSKFMKGGGCKESFTALEDCVEETQVNVSNTSPCSSSALLLTLVTISPLSWSPNLPWNRFFYKDVEELAKRKQAEKLKQLAERKQAKHKKFNIEYWNKLFPIGA